MPYDLLLEAREREWPRSLEQYREQLVEAISESWAAARREMAEGDRVKNWEVIGETQEGVRAPVYQVGARVWLFQPRKGAGRHKTMRALWYGPYIVKAQVSEVVYVIDRAGVEDLVHVDRLKLWRSADQKAPARRYRAMVEREEKHRQNREDVQEERSEAGAASGSVESGDSTDSGDVVVTRARARSEGRSSRGRGSESEEQPVSEESSEELEEGEFEVEEVREKRMLPTGSKLGAPMRAEYLIKWKGYDENNNSWEPIEGLSNCMAKVQEYEERALEEGDCVRRVRKRYT